MRNIMIAILTVVLVLALVGCKDEKPAPAEETTTVQPMSEHRQQAEQEITPENAEAELERLQKEIESDTP